jgi:hypothetical protein
MKKFIRIAIVTIILVSAAYMTFIYYATYSDGYRSGELIKITRKGVIFKTWEGKISQGVSEEQHFEFSVESRNKEVIEALKEFQGHQVNLTYIERFGTFPWMGDTKYYVTEVERTK